MIKHTSIKDGRNPQKTQIQLVKDLEISIGAWYEKPNACFCDPNPVKGVQGLSRGEAPHLGATRETVGGNGMVQHCVCLCAD